MKKLAAPLRSGATAIRAKTKSLNTPNPANNKLVINSDTLKTLTLAKSPNLSAAKHAFDSIVSAAAIPSTSSSDLDALRFHNSLLQSYATVSTALSDSVSLLRHMTKISPAFSPDRSTYHILLAQSCAAPDPTLSAVHAVLNLMSNAGLPPDKVSADIAVRTLATAGRLDAALHLFDEMSSKGSTPDAYTYNFLVKCLCKSRPLSSIYAFIEKTRASFGTKPDLVTYTILIDNVCNSKNLREMTRLVGLLGDEGFKPDRFLYNTIMKGHCALGRAAQAVEVYKKMKETGVGPDIITYNTMISGLSMYGQTRDAMKYLEVMELEGHSPDVVTFTALMNGLCRERNPLGAYALLREMRERGLEPNSYTFGTLLQGFFKARMLDRGMEIFRGMEEASVGVESVSYNVMVRVLCGSRRVAEAYEVFDYAVRSKSLTEAAAYATLESTLRSVNKASGFRQVR